MTKRETRQIGNDGPLQSYTSLAGMAKFFGEDIIAVGEWYAGDAMPDPGLRESALIIGATSARRAEFAIGRGCAQAALEQLGEYHLFVGRNIDRSPQWPAGFVGSITHTRDYVASAVCRSGEIDFIGLDAEVVGGIGFEQWSLIFTSLEISLLRSASASRRAYLATLMFSAKEAYFKAFYPKRLEWLDFLSISIDIKLDHWVACPVTPDIRRVWPIAKGLSAQFCGMVVTLIAGCSTNLER